ncbi:hypothetical protein CAP36_14230 [Chitinophagaceae bacterium IBVUCB2]|nr:hypothetical protein CAP36_14230 [Chitinophagaceae bacterium IBVUCB2]
MIRKIVTPKFLFSLIVLIAAIILFNSCSKKIAFQISPVTPAAEGFVKVKQDNNKNYAIDIELTNLAAPDRLQPPYKIYIVWMESNEAPVKNIGQINSSSNWLSGKLKASFETVSPNKPTRIFITGEDDNNTQYPGSTMVLSTPNF